MNVLLTAGPESTALFIITVTVQRPSHSSIRCAGERRILVPLNRWQETHRRLLRDGVIIRSVTPCQYKGSLAPDKRSAAEAPTSTTELSPLTTAQSETAQGLDLDLKEVLTKSLVDLTVESWCFAWRFEQVLQKLGAREGTRYRGRLSWFQEKINEVLTDSGMKVVNVEGHLFDTEVEEVATPINNEGFNVKDKLVVDRMAEPIIMGPRGIVRMGTVMLKAVEVLEQTARSTLTELIPEKTERLDLKENLTKSLVDLAVESWRFSKLFARLLEKLAVTERSRYQGQLSWFQEKLEEELRGTGMKMVNVEGRPFDPGMAVTPLNCEDFGAEDVLVVDRMLSPIIMGTDSIICMGTVMLKKVES